MLDHALEGAFCSALRGTPELAALHFFTAQTSDAHELPALTVVSKSEALAGSPEVFRADVQIHLESHAHDSPPGHHATLLGSLRSRLAEKPSVIASVSASENVRLLGYSIAGSEPEAEDSCFRTTLTLKVGYRIGSN